MLRGVFQWFIDRFKYIPERAERTRSDRCRIKEIFPEQQGFNWYFLFKTILVFDLITIGICLWDMVQDKKILGKSAYSILPQAAVVGVGVAIIFVIFVFLSRRNWVLAEPTVTDEEIYAEIIHPRRGSGYLSWSARLLLEFYFEGTKYKTTYDVVLKKSSSRAETQKEMEKTYPVGSRLSFMVNPKNPSEMRIKNSWWMFA